MEKQYTPHEADGFSLVELLIVVVILGVLATVAVFGVRRTVTRSQEHACNIEKRAIEAAFEAFHAQERRDATSFGELIPGFLKSDPSPRWEYQPPVGGAGPRVAGMGRCA